MRSTHLRFQAQYLRRIRLPAPEALDDDTSRTLVVAFEQRDRVAATRAALPLYGLTAVPA